MALIERMARWPGRFGGSIGPGCEFTGHGVKVRSCFLDDPAQVSATRHFFGMISSDPALQPRTWAA